MSYELSMILAVAWLVVVLVLALIYFGYWFSAVFHCNDKLVLVMPFWFLMRGSFDEEGRVLCNKALRLSLIEGGLIIGGYLLPDL